MSSEDLPILPALESMEKHGHNTSISIISNNTNLSSSPMSKNKNKNRNKPHLNHANSHKNAVENVMEELEFLPFLILRAKS